MDSLKWCALGFLLIFIVKYSYFNFMKTPILKILNPSYEGEEKERKLQFMLKLSYDTVFYSLATICSYISFGN